MKRPAKDTKVKRTGDVLTDLTQAQLAWIGSVALAYNENELLLDLMVGFAFNEVDNVHELTSRINGVDGKIALAKVGAEKLNASEEFKTMLATTLGEGGFALLKKMRDRIIHARIVDASRAIALSPASRGKFDEILLTEKGLRGVYTRIAILRQELTATLMIFGHLWGLAHNQPALAVARSLTANPDHADTYIKEIESKISDAQKTYRECQKVRLSLPPLPEFPDESELSATDAKALQERQAEAMKEIPLASLPQRLSNAEVNDTFQVVRSPPED
jgi:hypothetical protein